MLILIKLFDITKELIFSFFKLIGMLGRAKSYFEVLNIFLRGKAPSCKSSGRSETKSLII